MSLHRDLTSAGCALPSHSVETRVSARRVPEELVQTKQLKGPALDLKSSQGAGGNLGASFLRLGALVCHKRFGAQLA